MTPEPFSRIQFGGAVWAQWALLLIVVVGALLLKVMGRPKEAIAAAWFCVAVCIVGFGLLIFSTGGTELWSSLLGHLSVPGFDQENSLRRILSSDLLACAVLVFFTGGTKISPFKETYFTLPVLAIFLKLPARFLIGYSIVVAILFTVTMFFHAPEEWLSPAFDRYLEVHGKERAFKITYLVVSLGCFALVSIIGIALEFAH